MPIRRLFKALACLFIAIHPGLIKSIMAQSDGAVDLLTYRRYALQHEGDPEAGHRLFNEHPKLVCNACHRITGMEKSGPNLDGIGDKYSREQLVDQILYPSREIKPGYEQAVILMHDGRTLTGRLERATKLAVRLIDPQGKQKNIQRSEIEQLKFSPQSLMPTDTIASISEQEFADLISYLQTLRFGVKSAIGPGAKPVAVPRLATPVTFRPIHDESMRFENPVWCGAIPGVPGQLAVIEHQQGKIWRLSTESKPQRKELFLDLSGQLHISANQGLMCVAFHPQYEQNRRYFLEYETKQDSVVTTRVVERRAASDGLTDNGDDSIDLIWVEQPAFNHNGGCIDFGPDGMLYAAFGDGGPQKDPPGYSQNPRILLGSMVRIDVDHPDAGKSYGIPTDNPFWDAHRADPTVRPETWAIGFREPWRFSFDALTGDLLLGDVGQNRFEEVCLVRRGENHGWNVREGFEPFSDEYRRPGETYVDPLLAYEHGLGFSVTGGYVYRGDPESSFYGVYVFGDYNTRRVWGLRHRAGELIDVRELGTAPGGIASFGVDQRGEIMLVTYDGVIYHVDLSQTAYR